MIHAILNILIPILVGLLFCFGSFVRFRFVRTKLEIFGVRGSVFIDWSFWSS